MAKRKPIQIYAPDDVEQKVQEIGVSEGRSKSQMGLELIKEAIAAREAKTA